MLPFSLRLPDDRAARVLCLGAHSDDIEIGCGGTLIEMLARYPSCTVDWVVLSAPAERASEARRGAAAFLPSTVDASICLAEFRDSYFPAQYAEMKDFIEGIAQRTSPDLIFTHCREDRHQDHRMVSDLTWNVFRRHVILEYEIPKWDGDLDRPGLYVPLRETTAERKVAALLEVFGTQRSKDWFTESTFMASMRLRGLECRAQSGLAEAFHARKLAVTW